MTESSWAPDPMTEEEIRAYQAEIDNASEDEPPQLNPHSHEDPEDPPQIDRRTTSERLMPQEEKPAEEERAQAPSRDEKGKFVAKDPEAKAEKTEAEPEEEKPPGHPTEAEQEWFKAMPPEAQKHYMGLKSQTARLREQRRMEREEAERRFKVMTEAVKKQVAESLKARTPPPDPDLDPDGYRQHTDAELAALKAEKDAQTKAEAEQAQQQREMASLVEYVQDAEGEFYEEHPDYFDAINHAKTQAAKYFMDEFGVTPAVAQERVTAEIVKMAKETQALGGNVAHRFYRRAVQEFGWGKQPATSQEPAQEAAQTGAEAPKPPPRGDTTAATIQAGQKAAKGLGKGGGTGSVGPLTAEDVWATKNGEEFEEKYSRWLAQQMGADSDWTP